MWAGKRKRNAASLYASCFELVIQGAPTLVPGKPFLCSASLEPGVVKEVRTDHYSISALNLGVDRITAY